MDQPVRPMIQLFRVFNDREQALKNIAEVLESGYVGQGKWCARFEDELQAILGSKRVLYVNSGTSALQLAYHLAGVGPGTEVISTPITCLATNAAIVALGARIVWADVDKDIGNIDPEDVLRQVTHRTRAIVGVDWGGRVCNFAMLRKLTRGITLIEDAAHAFHPSGEYARSPSEHGDFICYSFQAIKLLNTADGGALVCPSDATLERARLLRWFGLDRTRSDAMRCYQPVSEAGWKMQGNDVLAAIGCANLPHALDLAGKHAVNAKALDAALRDVPYIRLPPRDPAGTYWLFTLLVSSPARFEAFAAERGVMASQVHSRNDVYGCFREFRRGDLPGVDAFAGHQVSIPVGWWLDASQLAQVVQTVQDWAKTPEARWTPEP